MPRERSHILLDLTRQLAGRGQDQAPGDAPRAVQESLEQRQDECGRLAGAGLGQAQNVASFETERNRLGLDRTRGFEASLAKRRREGGDRGE